MGSNEEVLKLTQKQYRKIQSLVDSTVYWMDDVNFYKYHLPIIRNFDGFFEYNGEKFDVHTENYSINVFSQSTKASIFYTTEDGDLVIRDKKDVWIVNAFFEKLENTFEY